MATPMAGGNIFELYRRLATGVPFTAAPLALPVPISVPGDDEVPPGPDVDELNRQFAETVVAAGQLRPTAQQQAEHEATLREIIRQRGNKGNALLPREALQS